jgi:hypothetical protein
LAAPPRLCARACAISSTVSWNSCVQVHGHDVGALSGQFQRDGAANAPARAGDHGDLILKLFHKLQMFNHESATMHRKN